MRIILILIVSAVCLLLALCVPVSANRTLRSRRWVGAIGGPCILVGLILVMIDGSRVEEGFARRHWLVTEGVITISVAQADPPFQPRIEYRYTIAGATFTGKTNMKPPGFGTRSARWSVATATAKSYPVGQQVRVYVNPSDLSTSRLLPGPTWDAYMRTGLGGWLYGTGLIMIGWSLRRRRPPRQSTSRE